MHDKPLCGAPFPPTRLHPRLYWAEFIGTAVLVYIGVSIVIAMFGQGSPMIALLPSPGLRRLLTGALFGSVGALIALSWVGRVSGAHINPAVSVGFWLEGMLVWRDAVGYVLAQVAGGIVGALPLLMWGSMGQSVSFGITQPGEGDSVWEALLGEAGGTFMFLLIILTVAAHPRMRPLTPLTLPVVFGLLAWLEGPLSGASANPARSLGPAVIANVWRDQWIYVVGPCLGAVFAVGVLRLRPAGVRRVAAARLFHFHLDEKPNPPPLPG
jgi:aquaporin Z